eukprot:11440773-Alexandrium_andersonii.AAC.1
MSLLQRRGITSRGFRVGPEPGRADPEAARAPPPKGARAELSWARIRSRAVPGQSVGRRSWQAEVSNTPD